MNDNDKPKITWHPVTNDPESLPEDDGVYLIEVCDVDGDRHFDMTFYDSKSKRFRSSGEEILAWAYLPEPYKEA